MKVACKCGASVNVLHTIDTETDDGFYCVDCLICGRNYSISDEHNSEDAIEILSSLMQSKRHEKEE